MSEFAITIRPIEPEDAAQAAQVWADGLQQTIDAVSPEKRPDYIQFFRESVKKELADNGMCGKEGNGLVDFYRNGQSDCCMFVAVRNDKVMGLVGVKRGIKYTEFPTAKTEHDYSVFSIWKLSVATAGRRLGIGKQLMDAAEAWVRQQECAKRIQLYTANPVAAQFYTSDKLGYKETEKTDHYGVYEKEL